MNFSNFSSFCLNYVCKCISMVHHLSVDHVELLIISLQRMVVYRLSTRLPQVLPARFELWTIRIFLPMGALHRITSTTQNFAVICHVSSFSTTYQTYRVKSSAILAWVMRRISVLIWLTYIPFSQVVFDSRMDDGSWHNKSTHTFQVQVYFVF